MVPVTHSFSLFSFPAPAPSDIYTLSLHDALPISRAAAPRAASEVSSASRRRSGSGAVGPGGGVPFRSSLRVDRKSTRLNSSHVSISYAVFCLKKKKTLMHDDVNTDSLYQLACDHT